MEGSLVMVILTIMFCLTGLVQSSCELCSPGKYLSAPCVCTTCPKNTFTDKPNNYSKCRPCKTRCEPSMVINKTCTPTHDTVCSCKKGKYLDPGILFCVACTVCPPGYGAVQPCSTSGNTVCSPCVTGESYSNSTSTKPCTKCSGCPEGYTVIKECTNITDTVCRISVVTINTTKNSPPTFKVPVSPTARSIESKADKKEEILAPILSVLVFGFVCMIVFIIFKLYKKAKDRRQPAARHDSELDGEEAVPIKAKTLSVPETSMSSVPISSVRHGGLRGRHTRRLKRNDKSGRESSDSQGSTGSLQGDKPRDGDKLLREMPNDTVIIEKLALLLNPKGRNNWVRLAGELGYSKAEVDYFNIEPTNATQALLADWETSNSSTIGTLYEHLRGMNRDDACAIFEV